MSPCSLKPCRSSLVFGTAGSCCDSLRIVRNMRYKRRKYTQQYTNTTLSYFIFFKQKPEASGGPSPFVFRAPLVKSAPSKICPSGARRSFSVSISLRTESQNRCVKEIKKNGGNTGRRLHRRHVGSRLFNRGRVGALC